MKDRILTAVKNNTDARNDLAAAVTRLTAAPPEMSDIEDLHATHETACDMYDLATRELAEARQTLTEAAAGLTEAEDAWSKAGAEMDAAARELSAACKAAGVYRTADGLRQVTP
jgi:DNA repair ATPase RecN